MSTEATETPARIIVNAPEEHHPPFYYIKKRFFANRAGVVGMILIIVSILIAFLGHSITPDDSPDANNGALPIADKGVGFRVKVIKVMENLDIQDRNFFVKIFYGQPSKYTLIPIESYRIDSLNLYYLEYGVAAQKGGVSQEKVISLVDVVLPLSNAKTSNVTGDENNSKYNLKGDIITYSDINNQIKKINYKDLLKQFEQNNVTTKTYILGTDHQGWDVLSRIILGFRISLGIAVVSVIISLLVGVTLGSLAGFFGGVVDSLIVWFTTVVWSIPGTMLVIGISLALQSKGIWVVFVAVGLTTWVEIARVVRGEILSIKEKLYVEAARALGMNSFRIIYVHILPNILGSLIVIATSNLATAILTEAGLSFLGLGVQPPTPSWGKMVFEAQDAVSNISRVHLLLFPSLCISLLVLAFNLLGNGLRDAYDPKTLLND